MRNLGEACSNYLKYCEQHKKLSPHSLKAYNLDLKQLLESQPRELHLTEFDKKTISAFYDALNQKSLSPASIKRKLACVKSMFKWLEQEEWIDSSPFHKFNLQLKLPRKLPRNVSGHHIGNMIKATKRGMGLSATFAYKTDVITNSISHKSELNHLTSLVSLELLLTTGIRVGELSSIQIENLDLPSRKIKIFGKGARERYVFIADTEMVELLKAYIALRQLTSPTHNNLLINSRGQKASTQFIRKLIKHSANAAKVEHKVTPHMLRHSAACELLESGLDIRFVQRLLGHASISTTEIYTHVSNSALQDKIVRAGVRRRIIKK